MSVVVFRNVVFDTSTDELENIWHFKKEKKKRKIKLRDKMSAFWGQRGTIMSDRLLVAKFGDDKHYNLNQKISKLVATIFLQTIVPSILFIISQICSICFHQTLSLFISKSKTSNAKYKNSEKIFADFFPKRYDSCRYPNDYTFNSHLSSNIVDANKLLPFLSYWFLTISVLFLLQKKALRLNYSCVIFGLF